MRCAFNHITVPIDGSTASARGVAFAIELARRGGRISFCSVVDPSLVCIPVAQGAMLDPGPMLERLDDDAAMFCQQAQSAARAQGIAADGRVLHGTCIAEILSLIDENGSDAVVIGTHGRTGLSRVVLGSVAEGLLRRSHIPVVAVHEDDESRMGPIAVALDASPASRAALEAAIAIADARGLPLLVTHVCNEASPDPVRINTLLNDAAERIRSRGLTVHLVLREGRTARELLDVVEKRECCMIVVGTHGRALPARMVLGSVAVALVERANVPVMTVHAA